MSDQVDADGNLLGLSNSGSHGSFSHVFPIKTHVSFGEEDFPTNLKIYRLGKPPSKNRKLILAKLDGVEGKMLPGDPSSFQPWNWKPEERQRYED